MSFNFQFRQIESLKDITLLVDFIAKQDLGYPRYDNWIQRTEKELGCGYKKSILAFSESNLVGNLLYQKHKELPRIIEIKNIRVHPNLRGRDFGHFLLKQIEVEVRNSKSFDALMIDAREKQKDIISLLTFSGYSELYRSQLYESGEIDIIFTKNLIQNSKNQVYH